jgi:serine/threonine protein kinase
MGTVYAAYDPKLDRQVAIKVLRASLEGGSTAQARLVREAQALARVAHPNVVAVHEVGERQGEIYIVMEFVRGETLRQWIRAKPRRWREVVDIYAQAGRGLAAAHAAGVIHRDFKP